MKPSDLAELHGAIAAVWPTRLVDDLDARQAAFVCGALFADVPLEEALIVVQEIAQKASPFPPSWPEIREAWQARRSGVPDDPATIAGEWLAEVYGEVGRKGGCFYRPMPEFSDPIIAAAVRQAAGSWADWGATPNGGPGEAGAFTRNLIPERDERFRRAVVAMLLHRRRTGDALPEITSRRGHAALEGGLRLLGRGGSDAG